MMDCAAYADPLTERMVGNLKLSTNGLLGSERGHLRFDREHVHEQNSVPTVCGIHPGNTHCWTESSIDGRSADSLPRSRVERY